MFKNILKILAVFIIGTVGGIFADQILWPYFIERPLFYEYRLDRLGNPVYVTQKQELIIRENEALQGAILKVKDVAMGVRTKTPDGITIEGSGIVITSDGLLVTLQSLLLQGSKFAFWVDDSWPSYQILKRDMKQDLALIKVDKARLKTAGFADSSKVRLGERVFAVGVIFKEEMEADVTSTIVVARNVINEGIISQIGDEFLETNIVDNRIPPGSPIFDIEGNLLGLTITEEQGRVSAIPVAKIREFAGF